jgi:hypothetical protein
MWLLSIAQYIVSLKLSTSDPTPSKYSTTSGCFKAIANCNGVDPMMMMMMMFTFKKLQRGCHKNADQPKV